MQYNDMDFSCFSGHHLSCVLRQEVSDDQAHQTIPTDFARKRCACSAKVVKYPQLGRELDVPQSVLSRWKRQANGASDSPDDVDNPAEKFRRLRRENVQLCMEHSVKKNDGLLREGFVVRYRFYVVYNPRQQGLDVGGTAVIEPFIYRIEEGGTE